VNYHYASNPFQAERIRSFLIGRLQDKLDQSNYAELMEQFNKLSFEDKLNVITALCVHEKLVCTEDQHIPNIISIMIYDILSEEIRSAFSFAVFSHNPISQEGQTHYPQGDQICWRALLHGLEYVFFPNSFEAQSNVRLLLSLLAGQKTCQGKLIDQRICQQFHTTFFTGEKSFLRSEFRGNVNFSDAQSPNNVV